MLVVVVVTLQRGTLEVGETRELRVDFDDLDFVNRNRVIVGIQRADVTGERLLLLGRDADADLAAFVVGPAGFLA